MRRTIALLLLLGVLGSGSAVARADEDRKPEITRGELRDLVRSLADDELRGREAGEPGCDRAAEMIASEFERVGLEPAGEKGTWFQPFTSPRGTRVLPSTSLAVTSAKGRTTAFELGRHFTPIAISSKGTLEKAPIAFAGYGISIDEPGLAYDDYAGLDVKGCVVVVLRHTPRWDDRRGNPFARPGVLTRTATFSAKAKAAADHGAAALIVINDPLNTSRSDDELERPGGSTTGRLPVFHMTYAAARGLGTRIGVRFSRAQRAIDARIEPRSERIEGATIDLAADIEVHQREMRNVVGLLRPGAAVTTGSDDAPAEGASDGVVVLGAHYDHVGLGHFGSRGSKGEIHNGADDNASGTSALLEIAAWLASRRKDLVQGVLFLAFSGEELGLLGSKHYVRNPCIPLARCHAMLNLDMIGRLDKNRLYVGGTGTSPIWPPLLERLNQAEGRFDLTLWPGGRAPSDHTSFYEADLPVLFFFTGLHEDYHRPSDDPRTLDYRGHERVTRFVADLVASLAARTEKPEFTRCDAGGFNVGPYTGITVSQGEDGVYVTHVADRSPAQRARVHVGDRIVAWDGAAISTTTDYNDIVSKAKPGAKVELAIERDGRQGTIRLTLGKT